jgi:hypothetical protein
MDESLQELEFELMNLSPHRPSLALQSRVEADLAHRAGVFPAEHALALVGEGSPLRRRTRLGWQVAAVTALASAAALAVWLAPSASNPGADRIQAGATPIVRSHPSTPVNADENAVGLYRPVGASSVLYDLKDDGEVYLGGDAPVRRVRYRYVDTYTWRNPATNASLKWSVPREEVRVLPASLH